MFTLGSSINWWPWVHFHSKRCKMNTPSWTLWRTAWQTEWEKSLSRKFGLLYATKTQWQQIRRECLMTLNMMHNAPTIRISSQLMFEFKITKSKALVRGSNRPSQVSKHAMHSWWKWRRQILQQRRVFSPHNWVRSTMYQTACWLAPIVNLKRKQELLCILRARPNSIRTKMP